MIFVTGWNEWYVTRREEWNGVPNGMMDEFNDEYSRDIEPSTGDLKDHYYYQLVNFVRQYKGCRPIPTPSAATTIDITQSDAQWAAVEPYYAAYIGNTDDRDADGYGSLHYTEYSGRNDIIGARVARDDEYVYFYVECSEDITSYTDPLWMLLYLDTDQENTGWESFDYVINKTAPSATQVTLERFTGNGYETEVVGVADYTVSGTHMQVKIPKQMLNLSGFDFTINFTWTDNVHDADDKAPNGDASYVYTRFTGDIMNFYTSGDVAPGARFKYSFISTEDNAKWIEPDTSFDTEMLDETASATDLLDETKSATDPIDETETSIKDDYGCNSSVATGLYIVLFVSCALLVKKKYEDESCFREK